MGSAPTVEHIQLHSKGLRAAASHTHAVKGRNTGMDGALGQLQWGPAARGDVPLSQLLDFFEWGQGWCARSILED